MEIEILEKKDNPLLDRVDVRFKAVHTGEKTPGRDKIRSAVASAVGSKADLTVVDHANSDFGRGATIGFAKVYKDLEKARYHERDYILKRNGMFVEPKKEGDA